MADWTEWCRGHKDLVVDGASVQVRFGTRGHRVSVTESPDGWILTARIASGSDLRRLDEPELYVWQRNRTSQLVGFRIDKHDRLLGEAWVPTDGMAADEFLFYVRAVATECDRLEALITGADIE